MNTTININLAGMAFTIDETAYQNLRQYLIKVKEQFKNLDEQTEIISDIESRIAELFQARLNQFRQVINEQDVEEVIRIMGAPEDFNETAEGEKSKTADYSSFQSRDKRLYRNPDDKILGGVCSGIAAYFDTNPAWIRLALILLVFFGFGFGFVLYILLWIVLPEAKTTAQKLQMRGKPVTLGSIESAILEELKGVEERAKTFANDARLRDKTSRVGGAIEDIFRAFIQFFAKLFAFVFKGIGFLLLLIGAVIITMLIAMAFDGSAQINGVQVGWSQISEYFKALMPSDTSRTLFISGLLLLIIPPIFGLIGLGARILFNYRRKNAMLWGALSILSTIGVFLLIYTGVKAGRSFKEQSVHTEVIDLDSTAGTYQLNVTHNLHSKGSNRLNWIIDENGQHIYPVSFTIKPTSYGTPYLELKTQSQGIDKKDAYNLASMRTYLMDVNDSTINLADFISIPRESRFAVQRLSVRLFLPVGKKVYISSSMINILDNVENVSNTWDDDMVNHTWLMTGSGLECIDCREMPAKPDKKEKRSGYKAREEAREALREVEEQLEDARREIERAKKDLADTGL